MSVDRIQAAIQRWHFLSIAFVSFAIAVVCTAVFPPKPALHDEFSYLLASDTFSSGRLTNPSPESIEHFETFHVIQTPTRCSKYPPGFALFLAAGQRLYSPTFGLCLVAAFAATAVYWSALGAFGRHGALVSWFAIAFNPAFHAYWTLHYMPGWPTVGFAALVLGAVLRFRRGILVSDSLILALGVVGLAITRPFEGLVYVVSIAAIGATYLAVTARTRGHIYCNVSRILASSLMCSLLLAIGFVGMAYYNQATTGSWSRFSYQEHEQQYGLAPLLLPIAPPATQKSYNHEVIRRFHEDMCLKGFEKLRQPKNYLDEMLARIFDVSTSFGVLLVLGGFAGVWQGRSLKLIRSFSVLVVVIGLLLAAIPWLMPHYFATAIPAVSIAASFGIRRLIYRRGHKRLLWPILTILTALMWGLTFGGLSLTLETSGFAQQRSELNDSLAADGHRHIVFVRYDAQHNPNEEWVYNQADLANAPVVWARAVSSTEDQALAEKLHRRALTIDVQ